MSEAMISSDSFSSFNLPLRGAELALPLEEFIGENFSWLVCFFHFAV